VNKSVEEIALKCGAWHQVYDQKRLMINEYFNYEKFAELIVKDCMEVVSNKCASPTAYNALVEHWGVEE